MIPTIMRSIGLALVVAALVTAEEPRWFPLGPDSMTPTRVTDVRKVVTPYAIRRDGSVVALQSGDQAPSYARSEVEDLVCNGYVVLKTDGSVVAWSDDKLSNKALAQVPVLARSGVRAITAGSQHVLALRSDGSVVAWGDNSCGQCTVPPEAQAGVVAIAAGGGYSRAFSVALRADGRVVVWGDNRYGQCAVPVDAQSQVVRVVTMTSSSVIVALRADGRVIAWGENYMGECNVPPDASTEVADLAAGSAIAMALRRDGRVVVWGNDTSGLTKTVPAAACQRVVAIAAGSSFACPCAALRDDGVVVCWGNGTNTLQPPPAIQGRVRALVPGDAAMALLDDGNPVSWSDRMVAPLPIPAEVLSGVSDVAGGRLFLKDDGRLEALRQMPSGFVPHAQDGVMAIGCIEYSGSSTAYTATLDREGCLRLWGKFRYDELTIPVFVPPEARSGITAIACHQSHIAALRSTGEPLYWGFFGDLYPVPAEVRTGVIGVAITSMSGLAVAVTAAGRVIEWDAGSTNLRPVPEAAQSGVVAVATGFDWVAALRSDGRVVAWGNNRNGATEIPLVAQSGVVAISANPNGYGGLALKDDGSVVGWGTRQGGGPMQLSIPDALRGVLATRDGQFVKAPPMLAVVQLADRTVPWTGGPRGLHAETEPPGLVLNYTYNGSPAAPSAPGTYAVRAEVSAWGWTGQAAATLTITTDPVPPVFSLEPADTTVCAGAMATFRVWVADHPDTQFQWQQSVDGGFTWSNLVGENDEVYTLTPVLADSGRRLRCRAETSGGSVMSRAALLTVLPADAAPRFVVQPKGVYVLSGQDATWQAQAVGEPQPTYRWQIGWGTSGYVDIPGANGPECTIPAITKSYGWGSVRCLATNPAGTTVSNAVQCVVSTPRRFERDLTDQTGYVGGSVSFEVSTADGSIYKPDGTIVRETYRWQRSNDGGTTWIDLPGTRNFYVTPALTLADHGARFRCQVTDNFSTITSSVANLIVLASDVAPVFMTQPRDCTVVIGESANFAAVTTALFSGVQYQWQRSNDGGATWGIVTSTNPNPMTYTVKAAIASDDHARFRCLATSLSGVSTLSSVAVLHVEAYRDPLAPVFVLQPADTQVVPGAPAIFRVEAAGSPSPAYQWQRSDDAGATWVDVAGETSPWVIIAAPVQSTWVQCLAVNDLGTAVSAPARVILKQRCLRIGPAGLGNWILDTLIGQRPADRVEGGQAVFDGLPADANHVLRLTTPTPPAVVQ